MLSVNPMGTDGRAVRAGDTPSHYLAFVQQRRLSSWMIRAVRPALATADDCEERRRYAQKAQADRDRLRERGLSGVWPWAYAAGDTPVAAKVKAGDVLWVFGKIAAFGRDWPPSLVARMEIAETHEGPAEWRKWRDEKDKGKHPGFPFADAHRFYAREKGSRFYPYNNAVPTLLGLRFRNSRGIWDLTAPEGVVTSTLDGALEAWDRASKTQRRSKRPVSRFQSLRRIEEATVPELERYAAGVDRHSVFVSYRWADHDPSTGRGRAALDRLGRLVESLVEHRFGVWMDRLTLPESRLKNRQGEDVLTRILAGGTSRTSLLLALVTTQYGGPSGPTRQGDIVHPGFTAREWEHASGERVRWELAATAFEHELDRAATESLAASCPPEQVALLVAQLLRTPAPEA